MFLTVLSIFIICSSIICTCMVFKLHCAMLSSLRKYNHCFEIYCFCVISFSIKLNISFYLSLKFSKNVLEMSWNVLELFFEMLEPTLIEGVYVLEMLQFLKLLYLDKLFQVNRIFFDSLIKYLFEILY